MEFWAVNSHFWLLTQNCLQVFICKGTGYDGTNGIAYVGSVCNSDWPESNIGLNEKQGNVLSTSEVRINDLLQRQQALASWSKGL